MMRLSLLGGDLAVRYLETQAAAIGLQPTAGKDLPTAGKDFDVLRAQADVRGFKPVDLGIVMHAALDSKIRQAEQFNVVGLGRAPTRCSRSRR